MYYLYIAAIEKLWEFFDFTKKNIHKMGFWFLFGSGTLVN